jgi:hypothetical protein
MITSDLVSYIKKQINNNKSKDLIVSKLLLAGWHQEDIDEGFLSVENQLKQQETLVEKEKENLNLEVFNAELPVGQVPKIEVVEKTEPKVWTPMKVPVKEKSPIENEDLIPSLIPKVAVFPTNSIQLPQVNVLAQEPRQERIEAQIPISKPIPIPAPTPTPIFTPAPAPNPTPTAEAGEYKKYLIRDLPREAMISSFESDSLTANIEKKEVAQKNKTKSLKWLIPIIIVIGLLAIYFFAFDYIKNIKIPFIVKDAKTVLLNNSKSLSQLKSYKTETSILVSAPSFSNISLGLLSGEAVSSIDKDSFSITTKGLINKSDEGLLSENQIIVKSSLLSEPINSNIKNDGRNLFIYFSDFAEILKTDSLPNTLVKLDQSQFDLIPSIFPNEVESQLKKFNIYNILSSGIPSFINNETLGAYDDFVNNVDIIRKGEEEIKGIMTYHYVITPDRDLSKKLLGQIAENFVLNLSNEDRDKLSEILGSTTMVSFEVWVGQGDNNIYQYNVILDIPLSKIIGFDDKSIGDHKMNINWKTTYYDFNINNEISLPIESISALDFSRTMKEINLKKDVSSFKKLATDLFKIEEDYGSISNQSGSCMNPKSGSLFSPNGHSTDSTQVVSEISGLLNKVMGATNGAGLCYSTSKDWSFSIPIAENYDALYLSTNGYKSYFCVDNKGNQKDLINPPTGVVCE